MSDQYWPKGPWIYVENSWQYITVYDADHLAVTRLDLEDWGVTEDTQELLEIRQRDCARLISKAPELVEALEENHKLLNEAMNKLGREHEGFVEDLLIRWHDNEALLREIYGEGK